MVENLKRLIFKEKGCILCLDLEIYVYYSYRVY